ncbi:hypothetical protein T440DRAFT_55235 [Plenodomus tracheiphilus IPT5]|uniref:Uncharacterized protein n=1 Tax=Plenodomus tracheiphilus IPT5 TaxID=1408161 RepID=A0A6A7BB55_9PLEO|nr:hypothetical protein T440DRAFT_55235 [Plenodomus tracheiphilus IPT5]
MNHVASLLVWPSDAKDMQDACHQLLACILWMALLIASLTQHSQVSFSYKVQIFQHFCGYNRAAAAYPHLANPNGRGSVGLDAKEIGCRYYIA